MMKPKKKAGRRLRSKGVVPPNVRQFQELLSLLDSLSKICGLPRNHNRSSLFSMTLKALREYAEMVLRNEKFWQMHKDKETLKIQQDLWKCLGGRAVR